MYQNGYYTVFLSIFSTYLHLFSFYLNNLIHRSKKSQWEIDKRNRFRDIKMVTKNIINKILMFHVLREKK